MKDLIISSEKILEDKRFYHIKIKINVSFNLKKHIISNKLLCIVCMEIMRQGFPRDSSLRI